MIVGSCGEQRVAKLWLHQAGENLGASQQHFVVETSVAQLVLIRRVLEDFQRFLGGGLIFRVAMVQRHSADGGLVGKHQVVGEGEFGIDFMTQLEVSQLECEYRSQVFFVGKGIDEAFAEYDGIANGQRFQRGGEQDAAMYGFAKVMLLVTIRLLVTCSRTLSKLLGPARSPA